MKEFTDFLKMKELETSTIEKYLRTVRRLEAWLNGRALSKEIALAWKAMLVESGFSPSTINAALAALNQYADFYGKPECRLRYVRVQRKLFADSDRTLTKAEYLRLVANAEANGNRRLALLMETIGATGIRVSELRYITLEAAEAGRVQIRLKGKIRTILLPSKLCRKLRAYAKKIKLMGGEIFLTRTGKPLSRGQIWAEMKKTCRRAGITASKVFPHSLRHMFAKTFYSAYRDIAALADMLGHSSIETTRVYLKTTGVEHGRKLECLRLVC